MFVSSPVSTRWTVQSSGPRVSRSTVVVAEADGHVAAERQVVEEEPLDVLAAVAERDHELVEAVVGVVLHDVPEDRAPADLDHRLRAQFGLLGQPRALTAREDDDFHRGIMTTGPVVRSSPQVEEVAHIDEPRVGIGLPTYNGERYLEEALDALLAPGLPELRTVHLGQRLGPTDRRDLSRSRARR